jgi:hypothetical protein
MKKIPTKPEPRKPRICWRKATKLKRLEISGTRHPRFFCLHPGCPNFTVGTIVEKHQARE